VETRPENLDALGIPDLVELGLRYHEAGQLAEAEKVYRFILQRDPNDADALHLIGLLAHQRGDHATAIEWINKAIASDSSFAGYHNNLGEARRSLGQLEAAAEAYRQAIRLHPDFAEPHNNLGLVLQQLGNLKDAIPLYRRAIALSPGFADAHNNLGTALTAIGRPGEGIACHQAALRLRPDFPEAWANMAFSLVLLGKMAEAVAAAHKAIALRPDYYEAWRHLAAAHEKAGRKAEAIEAYRQALRCRPDSKDTAFYLAALESGNPPPTAPLSFVRTLFDNYAPSFDLHLGALQYRAPQLIRDAVASVATQGKLDVLDLGCGTGLSGAALAPLAASLTGIDLSANMVEKARERGIYAELLVDDLVGGMNKLDRQFDLVVACDVFVYIGDLANVFEAVKRRLKPGGLFAFTTEAEDQAANYVLRSSRRYAHSVKYLEELAKQYGFEQISAQRKTLRTEHRREMAGWVVVLRTIAPS